MEERIILKKELLEELRDELPKDKQERLDYLEGNEISDNINEIADSNADIYNYELTKWLGKNGSYVTEAIKEFGDCNDLYQNIIQAQYLYVQEILNEIVEEMRDELEEAIETEENGEMFGKPDTEKKEV